MRFAIFGAGGAGGYVGARLAAGGHDVAFVARGAHLAAIRASGLRIESIAGDVIVRPVLAADEPCRIGRVECVILGVKAWQVADAARALRPLLGPETIVVPLQNGVEASSQVAGVVGIERTLGGTARLISFVVAPGHIRHAGATPLVEVGELDGSITARIGRLRDAFASAQGVELAVPPDIRVATWMKFLFLAPVAGVGAVARVAIGVLRSDPDLRRMCEAAMTEIAALAHARGIALPADVCAQAMGYVDRLPHDGTTSLQRDVTEGRPSELDNLSGAVVRLGREAGIATPTHARICEALQPLERAARGRH